MTFRRMVEAVSFSGTGLHTGVPATVRVLPGEVGQGVLLRTGGGEAPLSSCGLSGTGRGTEVLLPGGGSLRTTEHLFAALAGLGIYSATVELEGPEVPCLDGCSAAFARGLAAASRPAGADEMPKGVDLAVPVAVEDETRGAVVAAFPCPELWITYVIRYEERPIGTQMADFRPARDDFLGELAPARTFALASEMDDLRARGLALGGSLENALLVGTEDVQALGGLRFPDEFVRHKILDLLGDLYLLGAPLRGRIAALRSGHTLHCRLVEKLKRAAGTL